MTAARGGVPDRVPFTAYTGVFGDPVRQRELQSRGLGLVNIRRSYTTVTPHVETTSEQVVEDGVVYTLTTTSTPVGSLTRRTRVDSGYGSTWTVEHLVKRHEDYDIVDFILQDEVYQPDYGSYSEAEVAMGDAGVVFDAVPRVPIQRLWIEFTGLERLSGHLLDCPEQVQKVLATMKQRNEEIWRIVADSPAELVWCPDNISGDVIGPPWFAKYCAPHYRALAAVVHARGKRIVVHMDGMLRRLVEQIGATPIDIVEAFTPSPDSDLTLAEGRQAWQGKVLWINFPSSVHIASAEKVRKQTLNILRDAAPGDGFLIGITENVPEFAQEQSLTTIAEMVGEYGHTPIDSAVLPDG
ncbi:MAG: hypothetical protein GW893_07425 [Armatimonadetes bacterium]|nr:hypothetical protein [Armatimonadota bacterium]